MFSFIMAAVPSPYLLLLLLIQSTFLNALSPQATSDYNKLIPSCARECVSSFVNVHYGSTLCGNRSLQCLCSARGATPYTLGEGALQCLAAEKRVGGCSESVASDAAMDVVYHICDGQTNAITPTHSVITASLILPSVSGEPVEFPAVTTTTEESTSATSSQTLPTSLITETRPSPTSWTSTRLTSGKTSSTSSKSSSSSNSSTSSSSSSVTSTETSTTQSSPTASSTETNSVSTTSSTGAAVPPTGTGSADDAQGGSGSPSLSKAQIAGISVGVAVAAGLAIGALVLIRCYRRRDRADTPPLDPYPFPDDPPNRRMSTFPYLSGGNGGFDVDDRRWDPNPSRISTSMSQVPLPPAFRHQPDTRPNFLSAAGRTRTPPPRGHEIRKVESSESAFSSPRSRRMSKLLPAKPSMPPIAASFTSPSQLEAGHGYQPMSNIAPAAIQTQQLPPGSSGLHISPQEPQSKSQFPIPLRIQIPSEDEREQESAAAAAAAALRDSNITQFEEDSNIGHEVQFWKHPSGGARSDAPVYVSDKNGNWVLAESERGVALTPREPKSARTLSTSSRPLSTMSRTGLAISSGPKMETQPPVPSATKSPHSQNVTKMPPPKDRNYSNPHQIPEPLFSRPGPPAANPAFRVRTDQGSYSFRGSFTAFETSSGSGSTSGESKPPTPPEKSSGLSPVFESPFSMNPGQPIQPRERPSRIVSNASTGIVPPPRRPSVNDPPGQPSPTLGDIYHSQHPAPPVMQQRPQKRAQKPSQKPAQQQPTQVTHYSNHPHGVMRPWQNPAMLRTGSPQQTMRVVEPSPEPESEWPSLHSSRSSRSLTRSNPNFTPLNAPPVPSQPPRYLPSNPKDKVMPSHSAPYHQPFFSQQLSTTRSYRQPPPAAAGHQPGPPSRQHYSSQQQPPYPARNLPQLNTQIPSAHYGPPSAGQPQDFSSTHTLSPGGSSLLAKRLGNSRAAQMNLETANSRSSVQERWHRNEQYPPQQYTPKESSTHSLSSWIPRVTPTRRGHGHDSYHQIK